MSGCNLTRGKASDKVGRLEPSSWLHLDLPMKITDNNILVKNTIATPFHGNAAQPSKKLKQTHSVLNFGKIFNRISEQATGGNGAAFPDVIAQVMAAAEPTRKAKAELVLNDLPGVPRAQGPNKPTDPMIAMEGTLMSQFVDEMLPKGKDSIYGNGLAGDTWRGFAVDQMASALARADPLDLAIKPFAQTAPLATRERLDLFGLASKDTAFSPTITPFSGRVRT